MRDLRFPFPVRPPSDARAHRGRTARVGILAALSLLCASPVAAQSAVERPALPGISLAGDDGAPTLWRNPGSLALDPDASWYAAYAQQMSEGGTPSIALANHAGPLATGLSYRGSATGPDWWALSSGLSLRLDRAFAIGTSVGWQLPEDRRNFVTWDVGATWRPLQWFGLGAVGQNLFTGRSALGIEERWGMGLSLRPLRDRVVLSADFLLPSRPDVTLADGELQAALRVAPTDGLVLRGWGTTAGEVGLGAEVYFGTAGLGGFGTGAVEGGSTAPLGMLYAQSAEGDQRLFGSGQQVVEVNLDKPFPYTQSSGLFSRPSETYLHLLQRLDRAAEDDNVRGIVLQLDQIAFSFAQLEEVRATVLRAKANGKSVVAYLNRSTGNAAYLLATAADEIYLHPATGLDLIGLSAELLFLRETLDIVGVEPQVASRGRFKSAPETFTRTGSSPANREQTDALLDDLSGAWAQGIADGRGKELERMWELIDGGPYTAAEALELGLVDGLVYPDELEDRLDEAFTEDHELTDEYGLQDESSGWKPAREIAVVRVTGTIVTGDSSTPGLFGGGFTAGSDSISRQLRKARRTDSVKAVVLRVDSPGGSSFASDDIWRAVEQLKEADKPVVVSMGGTAASGGYYVSAGADRILANPSTITGSIGVYAGPIPSLAGLFEKLGVHSEVYTRGRRAAMWSLSKPLDEQEFAALDRLVGETYSQFKQRVSDGRDMDLEAVEVVAQGRVWSGQAALDNGLVDELGGFLEAIDAAREAAGIDRDAEVELIQFSGREGPSGELARLGVRAASTLAGVDFEPLPPLLPPELAAIARWRHLQDDHVWAMLPYEITVD